MIAQVHVQSVINSLPPPKKKRERERESFHRAVNGVFLFSTVLLLLIKYFSFFGLKTKYFQMLKLIKMK